MEKLIRYETLRNFAYANDALIQGPIRGIVLMFFGLGGRDMYQEDTPEGLFYAEKNIVYLVPYYNPWCWMNRQAVNYVDEIVDVLFAHYNLPEDTPIVSTGGSMGGLSALVYTRYARRTPVACVANCPVCDLPYHFTERPDLPRTLYSAFGLYEGTMEEAMRTASPLHLADTMPAAKYYIFHCDADLAVNIDMHSNRFVEALKKYRDVTYQIVPGCGHCALPDDVRAQYIDCIVRSVEENA